MLCQSLIMSRLSFSMNLMSPVDKLIKLSTNYEHFPKYMPQQLKNIKIVKQTSSETITEEILVFSTLFKKEIEQKSIHRQISNNKLYTEIISGPAKGTTFNVLYENTDSGTSVTIDIDLHISLKYRILEPLIKKLYRMILMGILRKMDSNALEM